MKKAVAKHLKLYGLFVRNSVMSQMEYRASFIAAMLVQLAHMCVKLAYVVVIYSAGVEINGFTPDEMMVMVGTYSALSGVFVSFFLINFDGLAGMVREGTLDSFIVMPVSLQFVATLRQVNLAFAFVTLATGGAMVGIGWHRAGIPFGARSLIGFLAYALCGIFLTYSVFLLPNLLCFWTVSSRGLNALVGPLWDFNNMPMTIYGGIVRLVGTFVVPVFLITNMGGLFIMDRLDAPLALWSIAAPIIFFALCRLVWARAMRRYVSAGG
ncbi:MAG: ABC-2 family transporter protein [Clostridiales bacterium]|nr:ABC-2 family transporter protein [Clostridiales bacterium]